MREILLAIAVVLSLTAAAKSAEHRIGSWDVIEEKDPITDQPRVLAIIDDRTEAAWFRLGCERGKALMSVGVRYQYRPGNRLAVVLRVDENEPLLAEWTPQLGSKAAFAGISRSTYKTIATAHKIAVQLILRGQHSTGTTVLTFPAVKTAEALRPLIAACPIEAAEEKRIAKPYHPGEPIFEEASDLITQWRTLNETCPGAPGDDEKTNEACEERLLVEKKLHVQGCSFEHARGEWTCKR